MSRLAGHTWRTTISTAFLDGRSFRVVRPALPVTEASLHEDWHGAHMSVHWTVAVDTLFITGSRDAFSLQAPRLQSLAEDSPAFLAERPDGHSCAEINLGVLPSKPRGRSPSAVLHIQICETHR